MTRRCAGQVEELGINALGSAVRSRSDCWTRSRGICWASRSRSTGKWPPRVSRSRTLRPTLRRRTRVPRRCATLSVSCPATDAATADETVVIGAHSDQPGQGRSKLDGLEINRESIRSG